MVPIYLCDDDPQIRAAIRRELEKEILIKGYDMKVAAACAGPEELLEEIQKSGRRGIYFLDVDLKHEQYTGFTLGQAIRKMDPRGFLIYVTAFGELAFETFRYQLEALDYIVKGDTEAMTLRVQKCLESIRERMEAQRPGQGNYCTIKILDTVRHIPVDSILYFEAVGRRHTLQLHLDEELLEFNSSLDHFAEELGENFWRCHRSFLVNRSRIRAVHLKEQLVELDNGETCLLSRKAKSEYQKKN